ncbi:DMT family transporter [Kineococcus indalonis]|uniref:DMT family transporter n=1 Tax=Kineococcus indalonis TaxID=2696566 RepID=UPI001412D30F|nr:DMT family transporter [Kineococcus indalonis]NAZ85009.1 EamA family transporter [Kineococcus indalonis]
MGIPIGLLRRRGAVLSAALSVLFVVCWSSGFVGAKLGAQEADVRTVLVWRLVPLALVLAPLAALGRWREARREPPAPPAARRERRRELLRQVAVGALSQSGYLVTVYWAIGLGVSTGTTALVDGVQPLVVAVLAGPLLGVAVAGRQRVGLVLGLAGVLVVTWADATSPRSTAPPWAYAVPVAGMLCLVAATFLQRRARSRPRPLRDLAVHCTTSAVLFTALAVLGGAATVPEQPRFWIATAWLVLFPTFGGYGLYWLLVERVGVVTVNGLMFCVPPVTTAWGAALFGEPVTPMTVAGLALALLATRLVAARGRDDGLGPPARPGRAGHGRRCGPGLSA